MGTLGNIPWGAAITGLGVLDVMARRVLQVMLAHYGVMLTHHGGHEVTGAAGRERVGVPERVWAGSHR